MNKEPAKPFQSLEGQLLLASPNLREPTFCRSVIFLAQHTAKEGAVGFVLNQPSGNTVRDLVKDENFQAIAHLPVFVGGPVKDHTLSFIAFRWDEENHSLSLEKLSSVNQAAHYSAMNEPTLFVRVFAGHAAWAAKQLESEVNAAGWMFTPVTGALFQQKHDQTLWPETLRTLSPFHKLLAECPLDPFAN